MHIYNIEIKYLFLYIDKTVILCLPFFHPLYNIMEGKNLINFSKKVLTLILGFGQENARI